MAIREVETPLVKVPFPVGGRGTDAETAGTRAEPRTPDDDGGEDADEIIPDGYETQADFLAYWIKEYTLDHDADSHNMKEAMEDLRFTYVDQWDETTRQEREEAGRPCLTINTLPQFVGQVVGDRRMNKAQIKVLPTTAALKQAAEARSGLIRAIESFSNAERVYDMVCEDQVVAGISNFEITLEYATNDAFDQDIFIRPFANPFAVTWDRMSRDVTGKDARHCFVEETMPKDVFEAEHPGQPIPTGFPSSVEGADWGTWADADGVKVVALWEMIEKDATFALMQDGQVEDVTGKLPMEYMARCATKQGPDGQPVPFIKEGKRTYARRWLITGWTILEGPYDLPLSRVPVIKVSGRIGRVGLKQYRFGLVRWARDPCLMRNYWRSVAAETLAMAPKNQWLADSNSVKGREDDFRTAHLTGDPLLIYNAGKNAPVRQDPPQLQAAVLNEAAMNTQDIKDTTGLQDASLGIRSNEVSGKAIMARQREGDVATITYHDHLNLAIEEAGVVMNELIPIAYDTIRTVRVIGPDEELEFLKINDSDDAASPNIVEGKYDSKVITGPSYTTQRMEAAESMLEAIKVMPEAMGQALDLVVEAQDWPNSERLAKRFRRIIPAAQQEEQERLAKEAEASGQPPQPTPEQVAQQEAQAMQMAAAQAELEHVQTMREIEREEAAAKLAEAKARAAEAVARAQKAEEDARKARADADRAEAQAEQADDDVVLNAHERAARIAAAGEPKPDANRDRAPKRGKRK